MENAVKRILEKYRKIAVYGMSTSPCKAAQKVPLFLASRGYTIIPINPNASEIAGLKCYKSLMEVNGVIEVIEVFRPSSDVRKIVDEAIARRQDCGDVYAIWLQSGISCSDSKELAENHGIAFIQDRCMYTDYICLFE